MPIPRGPRGHGVRKSSYNAPFTQPRQGMFKLLWLLLAIVLTGLTCSFIDTHGPASLHRIGASSHERPPASSPAPLVQERRPKDWLRFIADGVESLWSHMPKGQNLTLQSEGWTMQFVNGSIYTDVSFEHGRINIWEAERMKNFFNILLSAHAEGGGNFPNFEIKVQTADCPCHDNHCFSVVTCDLDHPLHRLRNVPYVQWLTTRDGDWRKVDERTNANVNHARGLKWEDKKSIAVYRGAVNAATTVRGLVNDPFTHKLGLKDWLLYGRGRLLSLRQEAGSERYMNVSLNLGHWVYIDGSITWEKAIEGLHMDEPVYLTMNEQADRFKYFIYAEGLCGWADRLKWQLAMGQVPIMQETRCGEWYTKLLKPWVHYIPVDGLFKNLTQAIEWAQTHDEEARRMAEACMEFASNVITFDGILNYTRLSVEAYLARLPERYRPKTASPGLMMWHLQNQTLIGIEH